HTVLCALRDRASVAERRDRKSIDLAPSEDPMPKSYSLTHLAGSVLSLNMPAVAGRNRTTTAALLAHLAECDARKLYLPAAYPSMLLYCVHELRISEPAALKRIRVAPGGRQFTAIFWMCDETRAERT